MKVHRQDLLAAIKELEVERGKRFLKANDKGISRTRHIYITSIISGIETRLVLKTWKDDERETRPTTATIHDVRGHLDIDGMLSGWRFKALLQALKGHPWISIQGERRRGIAIGTPDKRKVFTFVNALEHCWGITTT